MDKAREGVISSLTYTQHGLQWTKTSLAGETDPAGQNMPDSTQNRASNASGVGGTASAGQYTAPAYVPPVAEQPAAPSGVTPAYGIVYAASNAGADPNGVQPSG